MTEPVRIIARRIPWADLSAKPNRSGLRLRWDALTEAGEILVAACRVRRPSGDRDDEIPFDITAPYSNWSTAGF
jgi:hypothetical protein